MKCQCCLHSQNNYLEERNPEMWQVVRTCILIHVESNVGSSLCNLPVSQRSLCLSCKAEGRRLLATLLNEQAGDSTANKLFVQITGAEVVE